MTKTYIISGTDTGIGKTTVAAMLTLGLDALYWKPIQSGTEDGTDRQRVQALTHCANNRLLPEHSCLSHPLSPHRAAELDNTTIDVESLVLPQTDQNLIIEGAGGLLVPITRQKLQIDLFAAWNVPVILCARTGLGTINHTLLSIDAMRHRAINLHGIIFIGEDNPDNIRTIADFSGAKILGHVPHLATINPTTLTRTFKDHFQLKDFI